MVITFYSIQEESLRNVDVEKELYPLAISKNRSMERIFPNHQVSLVSIQGEMHHLIRLFLSLFSVVQDAG